jgi:tRNA(fMet)-specific endonuclease VapC
VYLLDANACIQVLNGTSRPLVARLQRQSPAQIRLSAVVKAELIYGAHRSVRVAENLRLLQRFFQPFLSLPFDDACAEHCGRTRQELARRGEPIGPNDLMIAATALAHDLILVTHNTGEFGRVIGLVLEDWESG